MGRTFHLFACTAFAAACGTSRDGATVGTVESSRVVSHAGIDFKDGESTAERFGLRSSGKQPSMSGATQVESAPGFQWDTPKGWTELPPTAMRTANFKPAGDPHAECYLTLLAGDAGGLAANANRWRTQLALPPLSASEFEALPRKSFFGDEAVFVEASGTWKGMSGNESAPGWGLAGLLLIRPGGSAFLKMTGPASLVAEQRETFLELARSFRTQDPHGEGAVDGDQVHDHPGHSGHDLEADLLQSDGLVFEIPPAWRKAPDRPMRTVSFFAGSDDALECYVATFPGEAGGVLANVNRWRGQLGEPPIEESALVGMTRIPMLGGEAVLVECSGKDSQLLGAACPGPDRSVFVKMSGPPDLVQAQRAAFLEFCASIRKGD